MPRHGLKFKLYLADLASFDFTTETLIDDATWTILTNARDLNIPTEAEGAENKDRASNWVGEFAGHRSYAIEGGVSYAPGDTAYDLLRSCYLSGAKIGVLLLDDLITVDGAKGEVFAGYVFSCPLNAAMADSASRTFRIGLAADGPAPAAVTISIGE